ncbi:MAG TPA: hypothetical protein VFV75_04015 [Candidatus Polarisedimenticolaceae bacterium]|nr:hypothetical protein [Candidatus Polarisedimenticolaceae bacterium]
MRPCLALSLLVLTALTSCTEAPPPEQPATHVPEPTSATVAVTPPNADQVDLYLYGLYALRPKDGGFQAVFLSPSGMEHPPVVGVSTLQIAETNTSRPDLVTVPSPAQAVAVWRFEELEAKDNVKTGGLVYNGDELSKDVNGKVDEKDFTKLRWVPSMTDIFGVSQVVDDTKVASAAARMTMKTGDLKAVFDDPKHQTEPWSVGQRKDTAMADGVCLRITLEDPGLPLGLAVKRASGDETILLKGGTTVFVTGFPTEIPKKGDDHKHFPELYKLMAADSSGHGSTERPVKGSGPSYNVVRCSPALYFP